MRRSASCWSWSRRRCCPRWPACRRCRRETCIEDRFMLNWRKNAGRGERGVMIIWLALFLLVLIGFGSLSVDVAKLAATRTQLQNAADAAALAAVSALDPETGVIMTAAAVARAQAAA